MTLSTEAWLADGSRVVIPERQYLPLDGSDRHYRTEPLLGSAHTLAVFFNAAPDSSPQDWECVGWCTKNFQDAARPGTLGKPRARDFGR